MYAWHPPRALSASVSVAIVALIGAVLVFGLGVRRTIQASVPLISIALNEPPPPPPPPKPPPPKPKKSGAKGKPSPANIKNKATAVVAPPVKPIIVPPPVVTAPKPNVGAAANTGASDHAGPGEGAGGIGNGNGGGGNGGEGEGEGDGDATVPPQPIVDRLRTKDLPLQMLPPGEPVAIEVMFEVETDGRVTRCRVERRSRYPAFDQVVCPLIERQYRYRPARDDAGRPVSVTMIKSEEFEYMAR